MYLNNVIFIQRFNHLNIIKTILNLHQTNQNKLFFKNYI